MFNANGDKFSCNCASLCRCQEEKLRREELFQKNDCSTSCGTEQNMEQSEERIETKKIKIEATVGEVKTAVENAFEKTFNKHKSELMKILGLECGNENIKEQKEELSEEQRIELDRIELEHDCDDFAWDAETKKELKKQETENIKQKVIEDIRESAKNILGEENKYLSKALKTANLVQNKQKAYGDSFSNSGDILRKLFPNGIALDKYDDLLAITRIIDKLFRIANQKDAFGESPYDDILGYALLGATANKGENK